MSETAKPHEQDSSTQDPQAPSAPSPSREEKRDRPVVWPKDLNAPAGEAPVWGADPEALRHG